MARTSDFGEADRLAFVRAEEDVVLAVGDAGADQLIAFVERHGDDAARERIIELGELALLDHALLGDHHDELVGDEVLHAAGTPSRLSSACRLMRFEMCLPLPVVLASGIS